MRKLLSRTAISAFLCASAFCAEKNSGATKNTTDLSAFAGGYSGKSKITANGDKFRGHVKVHSDIDESGLSGRFNIQGSVRAGGEKVPIREIFRFRSTGRVDVSELAPAVSSGLKEKGFYAAPDTRSINFQGTFSTNGSQGKIEGTYACQIRINGARVLRITYSVTLDGNTEPSFVYKFVVKPPVTAE